MEYKVNRLIATHSLSHLFSEEYSSAKERFQVLRVPSAPFGGRSVRLGATLICCLYILGATTSASAVAEESKPIFFACGKTVNEILDCFSGVREWQKVRRKHGKKDYSVIIIPVAFHSSNVREEYNKFKAIYDLKVHLLQMDIIDIPDFARKGNEAPLKFGEKGQNDDDLDPKISRAIDKRIDAQLEKRGLAEGEKGNKFIQIVPIDDIVRDPKIGKNFSPDGYEKTFSLDDFKESQLPVLIAQGTVGGKLYGIPYFVDVSYLYVNPAVKFATPIRYDAGWHKFLEDAVVVSHRGPRNPAIVTQVRSVNATAETRPPIPYSFQIHGSESVIANFFEWLFEDVDKPFSSQAKFKDFMKSKMMGESAESSAFRENLKLLHQLATYNRKVRQANNDELRSLELFRSGKVAFMRNWPFAYSALMNDETAPRDFEAKTVPGRQTAATIGRGTLGGWYLGITKQETDPKLKESVLDLALFMANRNRQRTRLEKFGYLPTYNDLYRDALLRKKYKPLAWAKDAVDHAIIRPSAVLGSSYRKAANLTAKRLCTFFTEDIAEQDYKKRITKLVKEIYDAFFSDTKDSSPIALEEDTECPIAAHR